MGTNTTNFIITFTFVLNAYGKKTRSYQQKYFHIQRRCIKSLNDTKQYFLKAFNRNLYFRYFRTHRIC